MVMTVFDCRGAHRQLRIEAFMGRLVLPQLDGADQAQAAAPADQRMIGKAVPVPSGRPARGPHLIDDPTLPRESSGFRGPPRRRSDDRNR